MPSASEVLVLRRTIDDVLTLAERDIRALTVPLRSASPEAAVRALTAEVPPVVQAWGDVAGTVSTDWYADVRVGQPGAYTPTIAPAAPAEQIVPMVRWAVGPLFGEYDWDRALADLTSGSTRLVRQSSTDTISSNSWDDPAAGAWVRIPRADACPFCLMLASRGAVYRSKETAGAGRGFHDSCRCTISPAFGGDIPEFNRDLQAKWKQVTAGQRDQFKAWTEHVNSTRP